MERLNAHMAVAMAGAADLAVIGPEGCDATLDRRVMVHGVPLSPLRRFFMGALFATWRTARAWRPHTTVAGSGLTAPFAWLSARLCRGRYAVYAHGLDVIATHWIYQRFWLPFIRRADVCIANSRNTALLCRQAGVPDERIVIVHPGVELAEPAAAHEAEAFRVREGWGNRPVMLSVGRLTARKGMLEFIENVLPLILERHPTSMVAIIGNDAPDALTGKGVAMAVKRLVDERGLVDHVRLLGEVDDATLALAYAAADVAVFPVRTIPGDVEGFGMVAVEAAARGLPTVGYATGGVPDAISDGESGYLVAPDDAEAFADAVTRVIEQGRGAMSASARAFARAFDWRRFEDALLRALALR